MRLQTLTLFFGSLFLSCTVSVHHPQKGESSFNSHKPTKEMSSAFREDLEFCRERSQKLLSETGLKVYRDQNQSIKDCLRRQKGWSFKP